MALSMLWNIAHTWRNIVHFVYRKTLLQFYVSRLDNALFIMQLQQLPYSQSWMQSSFLSLAAGLAARLSLPVPGTQWVPTWLNKISVRCHLATPGTVLQRKMILLVTMRGQPCLPLLRLTSASLPPPESAHSARSLQGQAQRLKSPEERHSLECLMAACIVTWGRIDSPNLKSKVAFVEVNVICAAHNLIRALPI